MEMEYYLKSFMVQELLLQMVLQRLELRQVPHLNEIFGRRRAVSPQWVSAQI